jgi:hypothetical protein
LILRERIRAIERAKRWWFLNSRLLLRLEVHAAQQVGEARIGALHIASDKRMLESGVVISHA